MESRRYTPISRNNRIRTATNSPNKNNFNNRVNKPTKPRNSNKRNGSRSLRADTRRTYRSKTPQPHAAPKTRSKKPQTPSKLLQYRTRKDSSQENEISDELPDYVKATTPQPHIFNKTFDLMKPPTSLQLPRSNSFNADNNNNITSFSSNMSNDKSMWNFVKTEFVPDMKRAKSVNSNKNHNQNLYSSNIPKPPPIDMIDSNNTTPIPMVHTKLSPPTKNSNNFPNTNRIRSIPKPNKSKPPPRSPRLLSNNNNNNVPAPPPPPPPRKQSDSRSRADSASTTNSMTPEFGSLLSPKEIQNGVKHILSHYEKYEPLNMNMNYSRLRSDSGSNTDHRDSITSQSQSMSQSQSQSQSQSSPRIGSDGKKKRKKISIFGKNKKTKKEKRKSNSQKHRPFNDEDDVDANTKNKKIDITINRKNEQDQIFVNKLHPQHLHAQNNNRNLNSINMSYHSPLAPPKSTSAIPTRNGNNLIMKPHIVEPLRPPNSTRSSNYRVQINDRNNNDDRLLRSKSDKTLHLVAPIQPLQPLQPINSSHSLIGNRPKSKTVGDYNDQQYVNDDDEFLDDLEVAHKSNAFNQSLDNNKDSSSTERHLDKLRFKCDQLEWNLNSLQTTTDKDVRQIHAKMYRVEHDMKTQDELHKRSKNDDPNDHKNGHPHGHGHYRRNSIFDSLQSSIQSVMSNVDSIKDALQTLDLRMSIINQRQHDIFKHIDETKDILQNTKIPTNHINNNQSVSTNNNESTNIRPLVLNALDNNALLSSRRASLQSMSEMLRLQSTRSMKSNTANTFNDNDHKNPLILPTYDDNEDILNPASPTKKKLMGHIRPELLLQAQQTIDAPSGRPTILPAPYNNHDDVAYYDDDKIRSNSIQSNSSFGIAIERTRTPSSTYGDKTKRGSLNLQLGLHSHSNVSSRKSSLNIGNAITPKNMMALHSIVEIENDTETESEPSQMDIIKEQNEEKKDKNDDDDDEEEEEDDEDIKRRRKRYKDRRHNTHIRSSGASGLSDDIMDKMRYETMLVHSDSDDMNDYARNEDDEKAMEYVETPGNDDIDEEKQYILNKENRIKNKSATKRRHARNSGSIEQSHSNVVSFNNNDINDDNKVSLSNNKKKLKQKNKFRARIEPQINYNEQDHKQREESYSYPTSLQHDKNSSTHTGSTLSSLSSMSKNSNKNKKNVFKINDTKTNGGGDRKRSDSISYDAAPCGNIKYEREVSRSDGSYTVMDDLDPLSLKNRTSLKNRNHAKNKTNPVLLEPVNDEDSMSELSVEEDTGTFIIHGDEIQNEFAKEIAKQNEQQIIQLMNSSFILNKVPNRYTLINQFIMNELTRNGSYLLTICNNTTSHDLFFKTSHIYSSNKSSLLHYFKESTDDNHNDEDDEKNGIITISENNDSDDHLAPMEDMNFGDIDIERGDHYCGYIVFEAYPFPKIDNNHYSSHSQQPSTAITPHSCKNQPITPHFKTTAILNAIDEKNITKNRDSFKPLKLNISPSTINKHRRISISTSSRRTSVNFVSPKKQSTLSSRIPEPSITSLLRRELETESNEHVFDNLNEDLDDLIDIVIAWDIQLSAGDPELNKFHCYLQFNEYSQPSYYHLQLKNFKLLKEFCHGASGSGLKLRGGVNNELSSNVIINNQFTMNPQIVFNIKYPNNHDANKSSPSLTSNRSSNQETFDVD